MIRIDQPQRHRSYYLPEQSGLSKEALRQDHILEMSSMTAVGAISMISHLTDMSTTLVGDGRVAVAVGAGLEAGAKNVASAPSGILRSNPMQLDQDVVEVLRIKGTLDLRATVWDGKRIWHA